jgi:tRNA A-37 threonylcarbamoyl transferase component Bud32
MKIYTDEVIARLNEHGIKVPEATRQAHEAAYAANTSAVKPARRKRNRIALSLFNIPGVGPSIPFQGSKKCGEYGVFKKHLVLFTGEILGIKTITTTSSKERNNLNTLGLLKGYSPSEYPDNKQRLAFPFYKGRTLFEFIKQHPGTDKDIDIALNLTKELKHIHDQRLIHGDLHANNVMVDDSGQEIKVNIIDLGRGEKYTNNDYCDDCKALCRCFRFIFPNFFTVDKMIFDLLMKMEASKYKLPLEEIKSILTQAKSMREKTLLQNPSKSVLSFSAQPPTPSKEENPSERERRKLDFFCSSKKY